MRDFVKVALVDALLAQHGDVAENRRHHLVALRQSFVGERGGNGEHAAAALAHRIGAGIDAVRQPLPLQPVGQSVFAAVADQVADQRIGLAAEAIAVIGDAELNLQLLARLRRNVVDHDALLRLGHHRHVDSGNRRVVIRDAAKGVGGDLRHLRQRFIAVEHRLHQVGGVVGMVERRQRVEQLAVRLILQRVEVAAGEARAGMRRIKRLRADLGHTQTVARARHRQLGVNGVAFAIGVDRIEQRRGQRVRHTIHRRLQRIVLHLKVEGGAVGSGAGVVAAAMLFQELRQIVRLWITLRSHQHHMLEKVRQPELLIRIVQRADRQRKRRQRLRRLRVGNQQHGQAVIEPDGLILARIFFAFTNGFIDRPPARLGLRQRGAGRQAQHQRRYPASVSTHVNPFCYP